MPELKTYAVWDAGTRWFHWINAICVIALVAVGIVIIYAKDLGISNDGKITLKTVHVWIGYVLALNLVWRIAWAFLGNRYAKWRAVLPGGEGYLHAVRSYVSAFIAGSPQHYLGHNPVGRIGVAVLLLFLVIQIITGLVLASTDLFYPPFGHWIAQWIAAPEIAPDTLVPYTPGMYDAAAYESMRAFRKPFGEIHEFSFYVLVIIVVLHVAAVIITELREGGSIISAMFTGRKIFPDRPVDEDPGRQD
jgi:Ni/Fe-hydrogenase 1 B-type cytochrome subunit